MVPSDVEKRTDLCCNIWQGLPGLRGRCPFPIEQKIWPFLPCRQTYGEEEKGVGGRRDAEISLAFPFPDDAAGAGRMSTETTSSRRNAFRTKMKTQGATMITFQDYYQQGMRWHEKCA